MRDRGLPATGDITPQYSACYYFRRRPALPQPAVAGARRRADWHLPWRVLKLGAVALVFGGAGCECGELVVRVGSVKRLLQATYRMRTGRGEPGKHKVHRSVGSQNYPTTPIHGRSHQPFASLRANQI
jgi:hypothetical protein